MEYLTIKTSDEEIKKMSEGHQTIEERLFDIRNYLKKDNFDPCPLFTADVKKAYWLLYNIGHADDVFIDSEFGAKAIIFVFYEDELDDDNEVVTSSFPFVLGRYH